MSQLDSASDILPQEQSSDDSARALGLPAAAWLRILLITPLFIWLFNSNLWRLWRKTNPWNGEENWRHAFFIPLIGIYYLYINREELLRARAKTAWGGLPILLGGILMFGYGIWPGQNDFVKDFGMVVTLLGALILVGGWQISKTAWFPVAFLVCAIPWPGLVYSLIAGPLQELAASFAVFTLQFTGVTAFQGGTKIFVYGYNNQMRTLNVAEACAGLRSLMTFISVATAVAFLSPRPLWQKLLLSFSAIPIAIFCNVVRVSGQGLLDHYVSQELSESFAHQFVGMIMLIPAFFLILLVGYILDKIFVDELDKRELGDAARVQRGPVQIPLPKFKLPKQAPKFVPTKAANKPVTAPARVQMMRNISAPAPATTAPVKATRRPPPQNPMPPRNESM